MSQVEQRPSVPAQNLDTVADSLSVVESLNDEIESHNLSYSEKVPEIADVDIRDEVVSGLASIQKRVFAEIVRLGDKIPYEELHLETSRVEEEAQKSNESEKEKRKYHKSIDDDIDRAREIIPDSQEQLDRLTLIAEEKKRSFAPSNEALERDAKHSADVQRRQARLQDIWKKVGKAWVIPALINDREEFYISSDESVVAVDEFPVDSEVNEISETIDRVKRRHPERVLQDASAYLAYMLADKPGQTFNYKQLADELYDGEPGEFDAESRVCALVSNFRREKVKTIGEILSSLNLVLQQGERHFETSEGDNIGPKLSIFRAVPKGSEGDVEIIRTRLRPDYERVDGDWTSIVFDESSNRVQASDSSPQEESRDVSGSSRSRDLVDERNDDSRQTDRSLPQGQRDDERSIKVSAESHSEWEKDFRHEIKEAIDQLEEDNLMMDGTVTVSKARTMSRKGTFATQTALKRLAKAKIIGKLPRSKDKIQDLELTPEVRVIMLLFNKNKNILTKGGHHTQKRAMELIRESIQRYRKQEKSKNK